MMGLDLRSKFSFTDGRMGVDMRSSVQIDNKNKDI